MQTLTNSILNKLVIFGLAIIPFIPLVVANSLFFPFITGKAFVFRIIVEIVFALWLILILREKGSAIVNTENSVLPKKNTLSITISVFTVLILISDIFGLNPLRSIWSNFERMEGWMTIVHLWAYFMVLSSMFKTKEKWHNFFSVVIIAGGITAIYGLFQFFGWAETHQGNRVDASLGNSAYMAVYMLLNAFIAFYLAISNYSKKYLFWIYSIAAIVFSFVMFQTATRGTILGWSIAILVSCLMYVVFARESKGQTNISRILAGSVFGLVIIIGILFYYNRDAQWIQKNAVLGRLATISISDTKTQARGFIWPMAIKGVFESPKSAIIGIGQENFNYIFNSHYNPKMYAHEQWFDRAHSVFLDWLVAGGLIGLILYLALYIIAFIYIAKSDLGIGQKSVLAGLLIGYGIHNVFVFDNQTSYVMFFTVLAYISILLPGKDCIMFRNYSKPVSEDGVTVRDYIYTPLIVIGFLLAMYFVNVRVIQANTRLIDAMKNCYSIQTVSAASYEKALSLNQTTANQEIREQLTGCATSVISNQQLPQQTKIDFSGLTKAEIEKQINTTPNDARIYIIGGSFYDSVRAYELATPLLEKANTLSPNKQSIMYELALNYINIGKNKEAADLMEKAYMLATENNEAKINFISTLIANNEEAKAKSMFPKDEVIFNDPRVVNAYIISKQYGKAAAIYINQIKANPDNADSYTALAAVYLQAGQDTMAIETLRNLSKRLPLLKPQADDWIKQIQEGKFKNL